ncbi:hypothetical protein LX99_04234 [Mucilaginibacter oryzae]|uniref:Uncharacterized protein n=1 Tax=Mucilaginibacter oryzae TaxID=468058 RepID=A0A316H419_9SPHI|nr:hypothetical protein [Mucilaginibacter oryzae]PWK72904.1 hypothetical protein LX99_04234 [Mucilaginibacter oryzae]
MKNLKSFLLGMALIAGLGGALATTAHPVKSSKPANVFWTYNGDQTPTQLADPSKYTFSAVDPNCGTSGDRCAIQAPRSTTNTNQPDLSAISKEELHN